MTSYVIEYETHGRQWQTVIEATDIEAARHQFHRDHPTAFLLAIYPDARPQLLPFSFHLLPCL